MSTEIQKASGRQSLSDRLRIFIFLLVSLIAQSAFSQASFIGHNLTPTTEVPEPGTWTVGDYALGAALPKSFFLVTSPWIWFSYNTANLHLKWSEKIDQDSSYGFFASYFKSFNTRTKTNTATQLPSQKPILTSASISKSLSDAAELISSFDHYHWESLSIHALYGCTFTASTKTYFSLKYSYYLNDDLPYSIRMDPGNDTTFSQIDMTSLTYLRLKDSHYYLGFETGSIGVNYKAPYLHMGLTASYLKEAWLIQLGSSYTIQFREIGRPADWSPGRYDTRVHYSSQSAVGYTARYLDTALHPEVQIQYFF